MAESKTKMKKFKRNNKSVSGHCLRQELILKSTLNRTAVIPAPGELDAIYYSGKPGITTAEVGDFGFVFGRKCVSPARYPPSSRGRSSQDQVIEIEVTIMMALNVNEDVFELDLTFHNDSAMESWNDTHRLSLSTEKELTNPIKRQVIFAVNSCGRSNDARNKDVYVSIEVRNYARAANEHKEEFSAYAMEFMTELYDSRDSTGDVKMVSGTGTEFKVHKFLLVQRSPFMRAALEHEMKEKEQNAVKLEECSDKAVTSLIDFLYKGWTSAIEEEALEMLQIAHLYQVEKLSNLCWDHVLKTLSKDTVFDSLILADRFGAEDKKIKFFEYLNQHHTDLKKTPEFEKFVRENTALYLEVCKI